MIKHTHKHNSRRTTKTATQAEHIKKSIFENLKKGENNNNKNKHREDKQFLGPK